MNIVYFDWTKGPMRCPSSKSAGPFERPKHVLIRQHVKAAVDGVVDITHKSASSIDFFVCECGLHISPRGHKLGRVWK